MSYDTDDLNWRQPSGSVQRCTSSGNVKMPNNMQCTCGGIEFKTGPIRPAVPAKKYTQFWGFPFHTLPVVAGTCGIVTGPRGIGKSTVLQLAFRPEPGDAAGPTSCAGTRVMAFQDLRLPRSSTGTQQPISGTSRQPE